MYPGDIVLQENTMIDGSTYKDNKINRLSVILFEYKENDKEYICSCPITNHKPNKNFISKNFLYIPYQIINEKKLCSIKLNSINFYPKNSITGTGLKLNKNIILKLYEKLLNLDLSELGLESSHINIIKENIYKLTNELKEEEKQLKKKNKRQKIKELKRS